MAEALARKMTADIVHVHHESLWEFASAVASRSQTPLVYTVHVLQSAQNHLRGVECTHSSELQKRALAECSLVHAPSQAVADALVEMDGSLGMRLQLVRLGARDWPNAAEAFHGERRAPAPMLLYVGRFADMNGFGQLVEAMPHLLASHPKLHITIAGGLPDNPKSEARWQKRWQQLCGEEAGRVHFLGWLGPEELAENYAMATGLLVPSWFETFGQVVLEGMLHGAPLITTGAGAIPELVDETCALIIETKSAQAICEAVAALLADPASADRRRVKARKRAQSNHHWNDRVAEFEELYRVALKS